MPYMCVWTCESYTTCYWHLVEYRVHKQSPINDRYKHIFKNVSIDASNYWNMWWISITNSTRLFKTGVILWNSFFCQIFIHIFISTSDISNSLYVWRCYYKKKIKQELKENSYVFNSHYVKLHWILNKKKVLKLVSFSQMYPSRVRRTLKANVTSTTRRPG